MQTRIIKRIILLSMTFMLLLSIAVYAEGELIKRGDSSDDVVLLQQLLKDNGYFEYEIITGYYGKITEDAVKAFQKDMGLKIDGITGSATWAALLSLSIENGNGEDEEEESEDIVTEPAIDDEVAYSIGMECADIALIQSRLNDLGFYNYNYVTGYFGSITNQAVRAFQRSCAMEVTGVVDKQTWDMLFDDYQPVVLMPGTVSENVVPLQARLAELGYYSFFIDGHYGSKTKEAVQYFQRASGLTANGVADAETQEALFSENAISEQDARRSLTTVVTEGVRVAQTNPRSEDIIEIAKQYLGYPYVYGGQGPDAFDCAGFTSYIYDIVGISLPNSIFLQNYDNYGTKIISRMDLLPGDLVFFDTVFTDGSLADHVGIYLGEGNFIHVDESFSKRTVVIDSLTEDNGWYSARFSWGRRIIGEN